MYNLIIVKSYFEISFSFQESAITGKNGFLKFLRNVAKDPKRVKRILYYPNRKRVSQYHLLRSGKTAERKVQYLETLCKLVFSALLHSYP
jgi:hypothetical protein